MLYFDMTIPFPAFSEVIYFSNLSSDEATNISPYTATLDSTITSFSYTSSSAAAITNSFFSALSYSISLVSSWASPASTF
jgi:hypothetical protein